MERSIVELLGRSALFGSLSEADRAAIAGCMRRVQFEPDQMIFSRGDPGREIYLVIQGRIRLSVLSGAADAVRAQDQDTQCEGRQGAPRSRYVTRGVGADIE